jgi:hypothetical protein
MSNYSYIKRAYFSIFLFLIFNESFLKASETLITQCKKESRIRLNHMLNWIDNDFGSRELDEKRDGKDKLFLKTTQNIEQFVSGDFINCFDILFSKDGDTLVRERYKMSESESSDVMRRILFL